MPVDAISLLRPSIPQAILGMGISVDLDKTYHLEKKALQDSIGIDHHFQFVKQILLRYQLENQFRANNCILI